MKKARNPDLQHRAAVSTVTYWNPRRSLGPMENKVWFFNPEEYPAHGVIVACARRGAACSAECRNFYATEACP